MQESVLKGRGYTIPSDSGIIGIGTTIRTCVPCDRVPAILAKAGSHDGFTYGLGQDCYWVIRQMGYAIGGVHGDKATCPDLP